MIHAVAPWTPASLTGCAPSASESYSDVILRLASANQDAAAFDSLYSAANLALRMPSNRAGSFRKCSVSRPADSGAFRHALADLSQHEGSGSLGDLHLFERASAP